ncbi:phosphatase PAP2 family protein [Halopiger xanaduensis]|uniref:Phosphoesterase PA-phosphatase related protein n=1 Tax=Halopiger xanaduensis (strain DSM 18323 / JCM 14033 / SH-6) TaxID=797210 RepID=F8DBF8_HALXS|nr:phosphatase PAP2 family protein [Halopiger xanaduensis]AEH37073.1 phosphoesterase PA-phosphatase related protein [Halopiger xanaduensis SH-6]
MRLEEASAVVREGFPAEYVDWMLAITELGGTTVPLVVLAVLFWLAGKDRRRPALVVSYAVAGLGFVLAIKALFGLPRPPDAVVYEAVELEGANDGFPSGHAFAATVVYGGLCAAYERVRDPRALLAVGAVVALVALSRVVLGVHYLGDVLAGIALGVGFLAAMGRLTGGDPAVGFRWALAFAVPAVILTGAGEDALLGLGGAVGGALATHAVDYRVPLRSRLEGAALVAVGGSGAAVAQLLESVTAVVPLLVGLYAALVAWILLAPVAVARCSSSVFGSTASGRRPS